MTTMIDRYDRRDGNLHDSIPIVEAAQRIARATRRDAGRVEQRLRAGEQFETAGYFYRLRVLRPVGTGVRHAE